jgi:hypothetical protein
MRSRLVALSFGFLLVALLGELLGRALGPGPRPAGPPSVNAASWVLDAELGFVAAGELNFPNHAIRGRPRVRTDGNGLRRGGPDGPARLLVVGDSTSFAAEVEDDETLPARLGHALGLPVANAGVRGYSGLQAARMLERQLAHLSTVELALYVLTTNDWAENLAPVAPAPRLAADGSGFRVVEPVLPGPPGRLLSAGREPGWRWWLRTHSALADLLIDAAHVVAAPRGHGEPGAAAPASPGPGAATEDPREAAMAWVLQRMAETCQARGVRFLVTVFPGTPPEVQAALLPRAGSFRALAEGAGAFFLAVPTDFPYLDPILRARRPWLGYDPHFGAEGTRRWAEALLPGLRAVLSPGGGSPAPAGSG